MSERCLVVFVKGPSSTNSTMQSLENYTLHSFHWDKLWDPSNILDTFLNLFQNLVGKSKRGIIYQKHFKSTIKA